MTTLQVTITLASPLLTGEPHQGNTYQSYSYLPGSVLRGAAAAALMAGWSPADRQTAHPEECADPANCSFCQVLYPRNGRGEPGRSPRFADCYPTMLGSSTAEPLPLTARTCKRHSGFLRPESADEPHGVLDTLIRQAAAKDAQKPAASPYIYSLTCPACGETLIPASPGYYGRSSNDFYSARPQNRRFSRTAINRRRHTAQAGQLFTLTVMGEQMSTDLPDPSPQQAITQLEGWVDAGDADVNVLRQALRSITRLGSGSSRGLGLVDKISVKVSPDPPVSAVDQAAFQTQVAAGQFQPDTGGSQDLGNRLAAFNQAIRAERAFYHALNVPAVLPGEWYFTIDILSDTFVRHQGLPALELTPAMLGLSGAELDFAAVTPVERGGWSNAWGLPRPRELGIGTGSVFLYRVDSSAPGVAAGLFSRLADLEQAGLGTHQARGAGRIQVCAPFHQEVNPR